ncbi:MAG: putative 2-aminoethylphosphonate ABC transporter substrate-binding protein [Ardenticatenaceae bacterium]
MPACIDANASIERPNAGQAGQITVYTALQEDQIPTYLAAFNAEYPYIKVNLLRESTGIITARLLAEKDDPQADVVWGVAATSLLLGEWNEILQAYAPIGLERVAPEFRDPANPPHWVGIDLWMSAFCVNTEEVKKLGLPTPHSWEDLLNPAYKGHLVMSNPNSSGTGFLSVSGLLQAFGEDKAWEYLDQLHENIAEYTESGSQPCKQAAAGEYAIGISFAYQGITQKENGKPIKTIFPREGSGWEIETNGLVKKEQIKPAAKTFLDWAISDSAMRLYAQNLAVTTVKTNQGLPEGFPDDPMTQLIDSDFPWAAANRETILSEWRARYDPPPEPKNEEDQEDQEDL